jgi:hypothetical protein
MKVIATLGDPKAFDKPVLILHSKRGMPPQIFVLSRKVYNALKASGVPCQG